jgi:hypothetical protein
VIGKGQISSSTACSVVAYLGDEDDLDILEILLEEGVGNVEAGNGPSEDHDCLRHFAICCDAGLEKIPNCSREMCWVSLGRELGNGDVKLKI